MSETVLRTNQPGGMKVENERTIRCPFCGGEMNLMHWEGIVLGDRYYFHCKKCYASTPNGTTPEEAAKIAEPRDYAERMGYK